MEAIRELNQTVDLMLSNNYKDRFKKQISLQKELLELLSIRVIENNIIL